MEQTLIEAANDDSVRVNSEAMRMQLNKLSPLVAMHEQISSIEIVLNVFYSESQGHQGNDCRDQRGGGEDHSIRVGQKPQ